MRGYTAAQTGRIVSQGAVADEDRPVAKDGAAVIARRVVVKGAVANINAAAAFAVKRAAGIAKGEGGICRTVEQGEMVKITSAVGAVGENAETEIAVQRNLMRFAVNGHGIRDGGQGGSKDDGIVVGKVNDIKAAVRVGGIDGFAQRAIFIPVSLSQNIAQPVVGVSVRVDGKGGSGLCGQCIGDIVSGGARPLKVDPPDVLTPRVTVE